MQIAIGEAERLAGRPLAEALPVDPDTGKIQRIKLVTDNGAAFKGALAREAEAYRQIFNHLRPHATLGGHRPIEVYRDPSLHPQLSNHDS